MKTSAERILNNIEWSFENITNLLQAFQKATTTSDKEVLVRLKDKNGNITEYPVKSFQHIQNELERLDNNFNTLINLDGKGYVLNSDGSFSQITKTSFINASFIHDFQINENEIYVDKQSLIQNFVFPNVKLPVSIQTKQNTPKTPVNCLLFNIQEGYDKIKTDINLLELRYMINEGKIVAIEEEYTLTPEKEYIKYYGEFSVIDVNFINDKEYYLTLDKLEYGSLNSLSESIQLKANDLLADKDGITLYKITDIEETTKIIKIKRVQGVSHPKVGINNIVFNQTLKNADKYVVGIPIKPNRKMVCFLRTENTLNIGYPTKGLKIDTSTYQVAHNGDTMSLDIFFNKYVTNFSDYLMGIIKDTTIPYSLGVKPSAPVLKQENFQIVQINKHLTTNKSALELQKINEQKQNLINSIAYKENEIKTIQNEIDTVKYKTLEEKKIRQEKLTQLQNDINTFSTNLLNITRDINNNAVKAGLKGIKPKYKLIGYWDFHKALISSSTKPQMVIGYEVQYRYLSKNTEVSDSTVLKAYDAKGNEINVAVSHWNIDFTRKLNKVVNIDGTTSWELPKYDSVDDINPNQCAISINDGESVEVRVRAISEAGYPISPMVSEWSNIIRYDFPQNLIDESLFALVEQNTDDLKRAELDNILRQSGIIRHINSQVQEAEKLFMHRAEDITSGFYTPEMNNIPLNVFLRDLKNSIDTVLNKNLSEKVVISVTDFNDVEYTVNNDMTIELNAGNYGDNINLLDNTKFGSIIRKRGYIKIKNTSNVPIELKTLVPGEVDISIPQNGLTYATDYYRVPVHYKNETFHQHSKQVLYFRDKDITGQNTAAFALVVDKLPNTPTKPENNDISNETIENNKNILYFENDNIVSCKLIEKPVNNFIGFTKEHPLYKGNKIDELKKEFERVRTFTSNIKAERVQTAVDNDTKAVGYSNDDVFLVGKDSCGAWLYPVLSNPESIKVNGNSTTSTLVVQRDSEILIPFIFEYRMTDRLGFVDGNPNNTTNSDITYSKKIGVDLILDNQTFKFDINVKCGLKSKIVPLDTTKVSTVIGAFNKQGNTKNSLN